MSIFVDTSAILAVLDSRDERNLAASSAWADMVKSDEEIVTSNYVVVETIALLHSRFGTPAVRQFVDNAVPAMTIVWVGEGLHSRSLDSVLTTGRKSGSGLVDCVSIAIIRENAIAKLFAYDAHFEHLGCQMIG